MTKRRALLAALGCLALAACAPGQGVSTGPKPATLPAGLIISPPGADVPADYAAFSGRWFGTWGNNLDGKLAVTEVAPDGSVQVVYAWGENPGRFDAGRFGVTGKVENGELRLARFSSGATVKYRLSDEDTLQGEYLLDGRTTYGTFARQE